MLNEVNIDFRIPRLPHSVVKQAENCGVRELVKKIENHPDRHALQQDLQQNKAYNPLKEVKADDSGRGQQRVVWIVWDGPKTQCKACLSYWSEGIVYCTCGHLLKESEANRGVIQYALDFLSIPEYVIKKGRPHGHRYGKTPQRKEHPQAFQRDPRSLFWKILNFVHPSSNMIEMKKFASKWTILQTRISLITWRNQNIFDTNRIGGSLKKSGNTGPLRNRSDFNEALSTSNRLHQESGERQLRPMPFWKYQERHPTSSSSSSWWQWSGSWWSSY